MIRLGHVGLVVAMSFAFPGIRWVFLVIAGVMALIGISQRVSGMRHPEDIEPSTWYYVGSKAPEKLPSKAPEKIL